jgi:transglutaminase-like putative cysteine protease
MYYRVQHLTRFVYSEPISESQMQVYMQPRTERLQRCLRFKLSTNPPARPLSYTDHLGNCVHYFDVPGQHQSLVINAESLIETLKPAELPAALPSDTWRAIDEQVDLADYWDMLMPTSLAAPTPLLLDLAAQLDANRRGDPLSLLRELNTALYETFEYEPQVTTVDSPIDHALEARRGVCQDFAHILLALVRRVGIPARYVSGYLYYQKDTDRSTPDASHAWIEALLPPYGWVGFDPTNNLLAAERHIRVGVGRDYNDVPPTKGVYKGQATSTLSVEVRIALEDDAVATDPLVATTDYASVEPLVPPEYGDQQQQQQ